MAGDDLALLRQRPQIEAAALYDARGLLLGHHIQPGMAVPPATLAAGPAVTFEGTRLELQRPVLQEGRLLGTVVLQARYDVWPRLLSYLSILAGVTLASLVLAWLVARELQRSVTDPIVAISAVARQIVQHRNFALRALRTTDDEVGALVDAFNDMLRELGERAAELQASDRRKDEFLATLAHELRNPLAPVSTALVILERGDADAATQARLVSMMRRQMRQFVHLIDDLMEVSRISTGRLTLRKERVDLVQVLRAAVKSAAPLLLERGHALAVQWPAPLWLDGDSTRLCQVFAKLLNNAAKYTEPGGRIAIGITAGAGNVQVSVADNGIGIEPAMQREVFQLFVQVDRSLANESSGLGVGLSLARQLVALHHGELQLHSAGLRQGATFTVTLPHHDTPSTAVAGEVGAADRVDVAQALPGH